jgi:hypothetical protein
MMLLRLFNEDPTRFYQAANINVVYSPTVQTYQGFDMINAVSVGGLEPSLLTASGSNPVDSVRQLSALLPLCCILSTHHRLQVVSQQSILGRTKIRLMSLLNNYCRRYVIGHVSGPCIE